MVRQATVERTTNETDIKLTLTLEGNGNVNVDTGVGFADHMLTLCAFWAGFDLDISCRGDLHIDSHHTLEDVGLCLGQALAEALGDKKGIVRVASAKVPMDEAMAEVVIDISGRPYIVYEDSLLPEVIAGDEKDIWREFLKSFAFKAGMNLHVNYAYGLNGHHLLEAAFKALGIALAQAVQVGRKGVSSTKGSLD